MTVQKRQISIGLLIALSLSFAMGAADAEAAQHSKSLSLDVDACIAKIRSQVDYEGAHRATHWVARLQQKNLQELQIGIETIVRTGTDDALTRTYQSTCVTNLSHKLVDFRIREIPHAET